MSNKIICPLQFGSPNNTCIPNCAWNVGSQVEPMCAMTKISLNLTSLDEEGIVTCTLDKED